MNRRTFGALALSAIAAPLAASRAFAMPFSEFQPEAFVKLLASGNPVVVHVHADW